MSKKSKKLDITSKLNSRNLLSRKEIKNLDPQEISQLIGLIQAAVNKKIQNEGDLEAQVDDLRKSSDKRILLFIVLSSIPALALYVINYLTDFALPENIKDIQELKLAFEYLLNPENKEFLNNTAYGAEFINLISAFIGVSGEKRDTKYYEALLNIENDNKGHIGLENIRHQAKPTQLGIFGEAIHLDKKLEIIKLLKDFMKLRRITNKDIMEGAGIEV